MSTTMGSAASFKLGGTPRGEGRVQKRQKLLLEKKTLIRLLLRGMMG